MNSETTGLVSEFDDDERELLRKACQEVGIPSGILERMILEERKVFGKARRVGLKDTLEVLISEGLNEMGSVE
jgi:hypothetical protein